MAKDNPWAGIGALDQKLYKPAKPAPPSSTPTPAPHDAHEQEAAAPMQQPASRTDETTKKARNDVTTSRRDNVNYRAWRDIIENTETHNSSLRLTADENFAVEDVITELKRHLKIKTSLNELARLGLLYLIHDFKTHREQSVIYKVKKS